MPSLDGKDQVTSENCGTETTGNNLAHHKDRCSVGTFYCVDYPNFSTRSQVDLNFHIAKKT